MSTGQAPQITVNGKTLPLFGGSLADFLQGRGLAPDRVAVEYNGEILSRKQFDKVSLKEGDRLEIVQLVGGG